MSDSQSMGHYQIRRDHLRISIPKSWIDTGEAGLSMVLIPDPEQRMLRISPYDRLGEFIFDESDASGHKHIWSNHFSKMVSEWKPVKTPPMFRGCNEKKKIADLAKVTLAEIAKTSISSYARGRALEQILKEQLELNGFIVDSNLHIEGSEIDCKRSTEPLYPSPGYFA